MGLGAEAEVYVLLVAGVGVGVVRGPAVELVAVAEFASDEEAESYGSEAGGDPAYGFDQGRLFLFAVLSLTGEGKDSGDVLVEGVCVAGCGAGRHILDDSSGALVLGKTVVLLRCRFCVIGFLTLIDSKGCNLSASSYIDAKRA